MLQSVTALSLYCSTEQLLYQLVVVLCNLKPSVVVGVESHCMLRGSETQNGEDGVLLTQQRVISNGLRIV
ncbi:hypothetical protein [Vibrio cholerae]|uniref:hypothetical protein n=1 Tax=Vibrio cholerae TaxID=666 RepID=UPI0039DF2CAD